MSKKFKIAVVQTSPFCRDIRRNLEDASKFIRRAAKMGARFVCLPELFDTGYDLPWVKKHADKTSLVTIDQMLRLAHELSIFIIGGIANTHKKFMFNSSFLFGPEGTVAIYNKNFLFKGSPQHEERYFEEGCGVNVVETALGRIGFAICNDIRYPELFSEQALMGARIIFVNSAFSKKRLEHWRILIKARALENQIYIAAANQTGKAGKVTMAGHSAIIDFDGNVLAEKKRGEGILIAEVDQNKLEKKRKELPTFTASMPARMPSIR